MSFITIDTPIRFDFYEVNPFATSNRSTYREKNKLPCVVCFPSQQFFFYCFLPTWFFGSLWKGGNGECLTRYTLQESHICQVVSKCDWKFYVWGSGEALPKDTGELAMRGVIRSSCNSGNRLQSAKYKPSWSWVEKMKRKILEDRILVWDENMGKVSKRNMFNKDDILRCTNVASYWITIVRSSKVRCTKHRWPNTHK